MWCCSAGVSATGVLACLIIARRLVGEVFQESSAELLHLISLKIRTLFWMTALLLEAS